MTKDQLLDYRSEFFDKHKCLPNILSLSEHEMKEMIDLLEGLKSFTPKTLVGKFVCGCEIVLGERKLIFQKDEKHLELKLETNT